MGLNYWRIIEKTIRWNELFSKQSYSYLSLSKPHKDPKGLKNSKTHHYVGSWDKDQWWKNYRIWYSVEPITFKLKFLLNEQNTLPLMWKVQWTRENQPLEVEFTHIYPPNKNYLMNRKSSIWELFNLLNSSSLMGPES